LQREFGVRALVPIKTESGISKKVKEGLILIGETKQTLSLGIRAYPNNPLYCGRLQSPMPALSAKNVLDVEKTTPPSIFGLPPWPRTFRSAS
jgi:hypothetical protein